MGVEFERRLEKWSSNEREEEEEGNWISSSEVERMSAKEYVDCLVQHWKASMEQCFSFRDHIYSLLKAFYPTDG